MSLSSPCLPFQHVLQAQVMLKPFLVAFSFPKGGVIALRPEQAGLLCFSVARWLQWLSRVASLGLLRLVAGPAGSSAQRGAKRSKEAPFSLLRGLRTRLVQIRLGLQRSVVLSESAALLRLEKRDFTQPSAQTGPVLPAASQPTSCLV